MEVEKKCYGSSPEVLNMSFQKINKIFIKEVTIKLVFKSCVSEKAERGLFLKENTDVMTQGCY